MLTNEKKKEIEDKIKGRLQKIFRKKFTAGIEFPDREEGILYTEVLETNNWAAVMNYIDAKTVFLHGPKEKEKIYKDDLESNKILSAGDREILDEVLFPLRDSQ